MPKKRKHRRRAKGGTRSNSNSGKEITGKAFICLLLLARSLARLDAERFETLIGRRRRKATEGRNERRRKGDNEPGRGDIPGDAARHNRKRTGRSERETEDIKSVSEIEEARGEKSGHASMEISSFSAF